MTYQQLYQYARAQLADTLPETAAFESAQLMAHAAALPVHQLPMRGGEEAPAAAVEEMETLLRRRLRHEPLQYLLGQWEFYGLPLAVGPGVLIPRPDTEIVVETALSLLQNIRVPVVADLCSGSGAIALALHSQRPDAAVTAVEQSPEALAYLRRNVAALCANAPNPVRILEGDVLSELDLPPLDMVVSNPPYLSEAEMAQLQPEVRWEPAMALKAPEGGLLFYRELPSRYWSRLKPGGWMALEVGHQQAGAVANLLAAAGYCEIAAAQDLAGIPRCVYGRRPLPSDEIAL